MDRGQPGPVELAAKTIAAHTTTYFAMGLLAASLLDYRQLFARPEFACWMRSTTDPLVMAGPLLQPVRGLILGLAFYPLRDVLFGRRNGWLILWWTLVALGILSTFGPPPGSIEGMIYTRVPLPEQLVGLLEIVPQALLLSVVLHVWVRRPARRWLDWLMGTAFTVTLLLPALGLLTS